MNVTENISLAWFKKDLRVDDHLPLKLCSREKKCAALYIYEIDLMKSTDFSFLHLDFINDSLNDLNHKFNLAGGSLNIFKGTAIEIFRKISENFKISRIYTHNETGNWASYQRDKALKKFFKQNNIEWVSIQSNGVVRGMENRDGWSYEFNKTMKEPVVQKVNLSNFVALNGAESTLSSSDLNISKIRYIKGLKGGEKKAQNQLESFLDYRGQHYSKEMSSPLTAVNSCSRLSPYLSFGNISVKQILKKVRTQQDLIRSKKIKNGWLKSLAAFSSRLRWHCHFIQKLEMQPNLEFTNMVRSFDVIRTKPNEEYFKSWKNGEVGIPMVDACMNFLKKNGWINFRMRAMLVSFASYNLWLDWRITSKFLAKYFIDYEPGIHYNQFQMQSGVTGINAVRIYNPIKQRQDHDPDGNFVRKWVPALENVSQNYIDYPHLMPEKMQKNIGCIIGIHYPYPIVDLDSSAANARKLIYKIKSLAETKTQSRQAYLLHGSRRTRF